MQPTVSSEWWVPPVAPASGYLICCHACPLLLAQVPAQLRVICRTTQAHLLAGGSCVKQKANITNVIIIKLFNIWKTLGLHDLMWTSLFTAWHRPINCVLTVWWQYGRLYVEFVLHVISVSLALTRMMLSTSHGRPHVYITVSVCALWVHTCTCFMVEGLTHGCRAVKRGLFFLHS